MIKLKMPIILIGFKHAGKTVLGTTLAKALQMAFTDLDLEIESHYLKLFGEALSSNQIAQKHGMDHFRALEAKVLEHVMQQPACVLALGGGTPLSDANQRLISRGTLVYIHAPQYQIYERIMLQGRPAFFPENEASHDAFHRIWQEREPIYLKLADHRIENSGSVDEGVLEILASLKLEDLR